MNKFYYLDHSLLDIFNYEIETDMTYKQICEFIKNKALEFCEKNEIGPEDYVNGEIEENIVLEIEIKRKKYNFNLYSALHNISMVLKDKPLKPKKISILFEELI